MAANERAWTDEQVYQLIVSREGKAFAHAIRICGRRHADEACDEAIVLVVARMRSGRYTITSEGAAWKLYRSVLRTMARNRRTQCSREVPLDERRDLGVPDSSRLLEDREDLARVQKCVDALDPKQRQVLVHRLGGGRVTDIAAELRISIATVSREYHRAVKSIREQIGRTT